ncbi:sortase domain-containing protein [Vagococcus hydrophili]|uniref:Sortase n=1 Tax=Vagococcus hydrophili TaxID=2714947 RepID=A0A6G8ATJ9_9ENTE|nr:sortase [Vagococcus hydrophili]QIL48411.1 hypothetical protein G7082_07840 [Vagococcus hydrophili]
MFLKKIKWVMIPLSLFVAVREGYHSYVEVKDVEDKIVMKEDAPEAEILLVDQEPTQSSEKIHLEPLEETTDVIEEETSNSSEVFEEEVPNSDRQTTATNNEEKKIEIEDKVEKIKQLMPMTMYIENQAITYQNGGTTYGQSIIDVDRNMVSTWGGAAVQSGDDGLSTHFIGHNPGVFSILFSVTIGAEIVVTDASGRPTSYTVTMSWEVDNSAINLRTGEDMWDIITGSSNGEAIVLQTCIDDYSNLILFAVK